MAEKIINYKEIPKYADYAAATNRQITVILSKYQAFLFGQKIKMMQRIPSKIFLVNAYNTMKFMFVLLAIFISCPRVAFLSDFHGTDKKSLEGIVFQEHGDEVMIIFNSLDRLV